MDSARRHVGVAVDVRGAADGAGGDVGPEGAEGEASLRSSASVAPRYRSQGGGGGLFWASSSARFASQEGLQEQWILDGLLQWRT